MVSTVAVFILFVSCLVVDISSLQTSTTRRTVIVTGANSGVGFEATRQLAATNEWNIVMACRSLDKAEKAKAKIIGLGSGDNIEVAQLDLADLKSVKSFCQQWGQRPLHVLACNAGIQRQTNAFGREIIKGDSIPRTVQGFEETIGVNHLAHWYMTQMLLTNLKATAGSSGGRTRVVFTGSGVHDPDQPGGDVGSKATLGDLSGLKGGFKSPTSMVNGPELEYDPDKAYKDSKLCNVMTSIELARRLQEAGVNVNSNVFNPGLIPTTGTPPLPPSSIPLYPRTLPLTQSQ